MNVPGFKLPEALTRFGLVGERKALSLLSIGFFATIFSLLGLISLSQMPEWSACFFGLGACYGIGFFALAADWFWGRWYAIGLGYSGLTMAIMSLVTTREVLMPMLIFGGLHGLISLCLQGERMANQYEAKPEWKARWKLDDAGVKKVDRSVTRTASSLPSLIMFALAPREGAALALVVLAGVGVFGLLRGRTWGILALGTAGVGALLSSILLPGASYQTLAVLPVAASTFGVVAGSMLLLATAPFIPPMASWLVRRR